VRRTAEAAVACVLAIIASALALATPVLTGGFDAGQAYYARPAFFPWLALGMVVAFGAWTAGQAWRGIEREQSDEIEAAHTSVPVALGGAAIFGIYVVLAWAVGYAAATLMTLLAAARWVKLPPRTGLILAVTTTAILYGVFVLGFRVWFAPSAVSTLWN